MIRTGLVLPAISALSRISGFGVRRSPLTGWLVYLVPTILLPSVTLSGFCFS